MKKALSVILALGVVAMFTACGNSGNVKPENPDYDNTVVEDNNISSKEEVIDGEDPVVNHEEDYDEDSVEAYDENENYDEDESYDVNIDENAVSDQVSASDESVIDDFKEAQDLWYKFESGAMQDYDDSITADLNGYENQFYRVTEDGFGSIDEMIDTLSTRVDRSFVEEAVAAEEKFIEQDGVLYACPAGRGDDMSIAWVDFEVFIDGNVGVLTVNVHRQDYIDELQDFYESGIVDTYPYPFTFEDGHAVFETMDYLCGAYPEEQPIEGHDIETYNALMEGND